MIAGKDEFIGKFQDRVVVIRDLPALICQQCDEAYYDPTSVKLIEKIKEKIKQGSLLAHPIVAGELLASEI